MQEYIFSTQSNNTVNLNADSDGDGITDPLDQCANTPNGEAIDLNGCAESQKDPDNEVSQEQMTTVLQ